MNYAHAQEMDLQHPEICLNLWAYVSAGGFIMRIAGKAYALHGDDDEKLTTLHRLSVSDFLSASLCKVPANFKSYSQVWCLRIALRRRPC
ncbi:MAG: hypothetical protein AB7Y74_11950 [Syntrophorhabdus sp.]